MPPRAPIDPATGPPFALAGRVITMDDAATVVDDGRVYVNAGSVVAVTRPGQPAPIGMENVKVVETRGSIYPGLIELHNHLSYDVLPLWDVPETFSNRDEWSTGKTYRKLVTGPMMVLGRLREFVPAVVRYVEGKCLLGGTSTSQGVALFSFGGITRYYRGIVRNVERTGDQDLPDAGTRISDVEATDQDAFLRRLKDFQGRCLLLHLAEGTGTEAHAHFEALQIDQQNWAITRALSGIHSLALESPDFRIVKRFGGSMVWSPLSNLLLYGKTADVAAAKKRGVRIGLGSDWSVSGSKNLLGELKVARLVSEQNGGVFSDHELVAMATRTAADILGWSGALGTIEPGKRADLVVVNGRIGDPYATLVESTEEDVRLVVINGVARYGRISLMGRLGPTSERWSVGGSPRALNLQQPQADPAVGEVSLAEARDTLRDALGRLPELAKELEKQPVTSVLMAAATAEPLFFLVLDHDDPPGVALRPHLPDPNGVPTAMVPVDVAAAAVPLSSIVEPMELDPPTVTDDEGFLELIKRERNLPDFIRKGLPELY